MTDAELVERFPWVQISHDTKFHFRGWLDRRLLINRCDDCGHFHHPPKPVCPDCWSTSLEPTEVSGRGVVHLAMHLHQGAPSGAPTSSSFRGSMGDSTAESPCAAPAGRPAQHPCGQCRCERPRVFGLGDLRHDFVRDEVVAGAMFAAIVLNQSLLIFDR